MKITSHFNKTEQFQYLTGKKSVSKLTLLVLALSFTACSNQEDKASTSTNKNDRNGPQSSKPEETNKHLTYDALAALVNIGLSNVERAAEIAIKEKAATYLITEKGCQTATVTNSANQKTVQVLTRQRECQTAVNPSTQWESNETFTAELTDGLLASLTTSLGDWIEIKSVSPQHHYRIRQNTRLTPDSNRVSNSIYDFNSSTQIATEMIEGRKSRHAEFAIQIYGSAQLDSATGLMKAVSIESAEVYVRRDDKVDRYETTSTLTLTPKNTALVPVTCGRYVGEMAFHQKISSSSSRTVHTYSGNIIFSADAVEDGNKQNSAIKTSISECKPGLANLENYLRGAATKVINLMKAVKPNTTNDRQVVSE